MSLSVSATGGINNAPQVTVVTDIPSPYQVELFNAVAEHGTLSLRTVYSRSQDKHRPWGGLKLSHDACFLDLGTRLQAQDWIESAQLAVFSGYRLPGIQKLMRRRHRLGKPWAFWGERPGYRSAGRLGRLLRRWPTRLIRNCGAPIWGIGEWALEGYRAELGDTDRLYVNVPYFSNLGRFTAPSSDRRKTSTCKFLFSGQLIHRKGVDILVEAFGRLVRESLPVELHLLGDGPLRNQLQMAVKDFSSKVFFHGYQPWQSLPEYYQEASILCAPSRHDGWALVVPEGLAAGLPVIATDRTGAARQLLNPGNGWLIPANNVEALYQAMKQAAATAPEDYLGLSMNARASAQQADLPAGVTCFNRAVESTLNHWRAVQQ